MFNIHMPLCISNFDVSFSAQNNKLLYVLIMENFMSNKSDRTINMRIGNLLRSAREAGNVTQAEMAQATGMTKNHISAIERGVSKASVELLLGYCKKLDMSADALLGLSDSKILPELLSELSYMNHSEQGKILAMIRLMKS